MKILLATDGSAHSQAAIDLLNRILGSLTMVNFLGS